MCGRFALTLPPDAVAGWFDAVHVKASFEPRYNICPTTDIPVAVNYEGERHLVPMRWGFIPKWYKSPSDGPMLINARAETIAEKPAFRSAVQTRRCLIPADGFYEWHREKGKGKEPWYIYPNEGELMAFAGIWQVWKGPDGARSVTCAMVTTAAGEDLAQVHHREPVTIKPDDFGLWLGEEGKGAASLMHAADPAYFVRHRVGLEVNSGRVEGAELRDPLD
ncbi:SOS response-associated peptidase [Amylibacter sp. IMCC11727]|uniref:SOS response-associated peptidase n=1 Tax=Amylibacter sp. IMCC11727 TaxID=3039851 RepID=UPI00244E3337|nr:SOS response-associated peptidase [Amylibacter sp. IMCC11727]WGI20261.1 SOS response-associated peptidase [Amylibacter sp. IMCC11727]